MSMFYNFSLTISIQVIWRVMILVLIFTSNRDLSSLWLLPRGPSLPVQYCQSRPDNITLIVLCLSSQEPLSGRSISWAWLTYLLSTTQRRKPLMQQKLSNTGWVARATGRKEVEGCCQAAQNTESYLHGGRCLMFPLLSCHKAHDVERRCWWPLSALCLLPPLSFAAGWRWNLHSPPRAVRQTVPRLHLKHFCVTLSYEHCHKSIQLRAIRLFYHWPKKKKNRTHTDHYLSVVIWGETT